MADSSEPPGADPIPARGRLLGLDYGTKRVGLALSNAEQTIATPVETYQRRDELQDARYLRQKVEEFTIVGLVVGLPVHMSGDEGEKAREARAYGTWAARVTKLPLTYCDERYTTVQADEILRGAALSPKQRKARRDMLAAQILLQTFLESGRRDTAPGALSQ
jgi:putative Holliday junction resolvase